MAKHGIMLLYGFRHYFIFVTCEKIGIQMTSKTLQFCFWDSNNTEIGTWQINGW